METTTKKQAIVQSIDAMNASEMEKVIGFIRELSQGQEVNRSYIEFKKRALNEIQEALNSTSRFEVSA